MANSFLNFFTHPRATKHNNKKLLHIPIFEALGLAIVPGLCLIRVGALIFSLYFILIYLIFLREGLQVERPRVRVPVRTYQDSNYEDLSSFLFQRRKIREVDRRMSYDDFLDEYEVTEEDFWLERQMMF